MIILNTFPTAHEFYTTYWGKKPFMVRGYIEPSLFDDFVDGDTLAGLSLEDDVKSRIVTTEPSGIKWTCDNGPFPDDHYETLGDSHWGLLVQNVEQYHPLTADLLNHFNFSPRWLLDDIMVSYSTEHGTVGPHIDSYHVFLVQGIGQRIWTVGDKPISNAKNIKGLDLLVLEDGVDGDPIEVNTGDVIYIPPHFGHQGVTTQTAMTFSVGFLGPKLSELFIEYGYYLEQCEQHNIRYTGQNLSEDSAHFTIANDAKNTIQTYMCDAIRHDNFATWLCDYFSTPTHNETVMPRDEILSSNDILKKLQSGINLYRPEHVKLTIATSENGNHNLGFFGNSLTLENNCNYLIEILKRNENILFSDIKLLKDIDTVMDAITHLYNQNVLYFEDEDFE
jgi:50S ribosomal protein L16 3-hydroxylase